MPDRIIIDFDGEEKEPDKDAGQNSDKRSGSDEKEKERIVIEFDETPEEHIEEVAEESYEETFIKSKINCFYKGNSYLNNF
ncbi:MAG: hypothetical protein R3A12_00990 [Ignavibacteria bacterium]